MRNYYQEKFRPQTGLAGTRQNRQCPQPYQTLFAQPRRGNLMNTCPRCHQPVEETDCYCRHCGKTLKPRMGFWYDHGGILLLTLIVGPFSLFCVWLSRKISTTAKCLWTLGILFMSAYLIYSLYKTALLLKELLAAMFSL